MRFGPYFAEINSDFEDIAGELVTEAYLDPKGVPTGPGGRTEINGVPVKMGQMWTPAEARQIYADGKKDFAEATWAMIDPKVRPQIKQHMFDGIGRLGWNIGLSALKKSSALALINQGEFERAAARFLVWRRITLKGGTIGPDDRLVRGPDGEPLPQGHEWFKTSRGVYRSSISAALLLSGHGWRKAAAANKVTLKSYPVQVSDTRYEDRVTSEMDWKEILADAKDDPLPVIQGAPDPELFDLEPTKMERLEHESLKAAGSEDTLQEYVAHRRGIVMPVGSKPLSINTKQAEEVPYGIDPKAGGQPKEEAERVRRYVKKKQGVDMKKTGQALTVASGAVAAANSFSDETRTFFSSLGTVGLTVLALALAAGVIYWIVGWVREKWNERKEAEAEINAVQWLY